MNGRTALVTGGSRGIGAAIATRLAAEGARVLAPPRSELDLADPRSVQGYLAGLGTEVDILIHCAGVNRPQPLADIEDAVIDETLAVNLAGPLRLSRGLAPAMAARGYGRIVSISSVWAVVGREGRAAYAASKAGLAGMTLSLALEFARRGVLVNAVAPGYVATDLTRQNNSPEELVRVAEAIPLGRLAAPEEVAELVAFLGSSRNSYVTGQLVVCDGGFSCR